LHDNTRATAHGIFLASDETQEERTMPVILWLLGVPLSVVIILLLLRVI
jgi:hypothetical protein